MADNNAVITMDSNQNIMSHKSYIDPTLGIIIHNSSIFDLKFISLIYSLLTNNETYKNAVQLSTQLLEDFDQDKIRNEIIRLYQEVIAASAQPAYQRVARWCINAIPYA